MKTDLSVIKMKGESEVPLLKLSARHRVCVGAAGAAMSPQYLIRAQLCSVWCHLQRVPCLSDCQHVVFHLQDPLGHWWEKPPRLMSAQPRDSSGARDSGTGDGGAGDSRTGALGQRMVGQGRRGRG